MKQYKRFTINYRDKGLDGLLWDFYHDIMSTSKTQANKKAREILAKKYPDARLVQVIPN